MAVVPQERFHCNICFEENVIYMYVKINVACLIMSITVKSYLKSSVLGVSSDISLVISSNWST